MDAGLTGGLIGAGGLALCLGSVFLYDCIKKYKEKRALVLSPRVVEVVVHSKSSMRDLLSNPSHSLGQATPLPKKIGA